MKLKMESINQEFQELKQKRVEEINNAREKIMNETIIKAKKLQLVYALFEMLIGMTGYLIIGFMVSWWLVIGLFMVNWSSNLGNRRTQNQNKKNIWTEIWKL